ncbi:PTS sugar transporter subunit IIA [Sporolactobacillus spathodeae]|uniref:PTS system galactitol-specific IIA component n=1 Tax=Sporolactobacillus spathodeae TaxID=1465502 RepID=A0ABS2Q669_9BACL|nr:PTS sugar transporter subunit IIA [Sporolactobacillus spathodeae]MBM7657284.1 PTS system galactitol-specific IIA component [Sporolactobacillus spathodeae]
MGLPLDIQENDILSISAANQKQLFERLGEILEQRGEVTDAFSEAIFGREQQFPTALDMQPLFAGGPNIAIPHTEPAFCKTKKVVVVRLEQPVDFRNMINPKEIISVQFLFAILNDNPSAQTNILANLMDLFKSEHFLERLGQTTSAHDVCQVLQQYANFECA